MLPEFDGLFDERPQGQIGRVKREAEVYSGREVLGVVADHERLEPLGHDFGCKAEHREAVAVEGIKLAVEFNARDVLSENPKD